MDKSIEAKLSWRYGLIVNTLIMNDGRLYKDQLIQITELTESQIAKALQYGRRNFDFNKNSIRNYVMSCGDGYFLPESEAETIAYVAQNLKDIYSRTKTLKPIVTYAKEKYPIELSGAMLRTDWSETDEMEPWAVFNKLMEDITL